MASVVSAPYFVHTIHTVVRLPTPVQAVSPSALEGEPRAMRVPPRRMSVFARLRVCTNRD